MEFDDQAGYQRRYVDDYLDEVRSLPAILLEGARGVGKTATASQRCRTIRALDEPGAAEIVAADPYVIATDDAPVLIDEWQRSEPVWDAVRRLVDRESVPGRFFLTGSLPRGGTHSGAGRIHAVRMRPLCLAERGVAEPTVSFAALLRGNAEVGGRSGFTLSDYVDEILASGFPGLRRLDGRALITALDGYLARLVDRDIPDAGHQVRRPDTLRSWLRAYAAATATTASWEKIRVGSAGAGTEAPAKSTILDYTEALIALAVLDPIDPWTPSRNHLRAAGQARKHHLVDPALAARLLRRDRQHLLTGEDGGKSPADGVLLGNLFESLATLSVRNAAQPADAEIYHFRENTGRHEVDLIASTGDGIVAIECKLGATVDDADTKHLRWLRGQLGDDLIDAVVLTTGPEAYRRADGIAIIPLALLGA